MSKQSGKSNIADDAARARKLLDKHVPLKVSGLNKGNFSLQQGVKQNLGEHAVIVIISEQTVHQYTISRPIGVTEGDEKLDWVINSTEYLPSMMARKADPAIGALNQERAQLRTQLAVDVSLLVSKERDGKHVHFYPNRLDMPRNDLLQEARFRLKERQSELRQLIDEETDKAKKVAYSNQLTQLVDPAEFLDEVTSTSERNLRKFWESEEVQAVLEAEVPQLYRTLTGPYADQAQMLINGAKGKSLDTVVNAVSAKIAEIAIAPPTVLAKQQVESSSPEPSMKEQVKPGPPSVVGTTGKIPDLATKQKLRDKVSNLGKKFTSIATSVAGDLNLIKRASQDSGGKVATPPPPTVSPPKAPTTPKDGQSVPIPDLPETH